MPRVSIGEAIGAAVNLSMRSAADEDDDKAFIKKKQDSFASEGIGKNDVDQYVKGALVAFHNERAAKAHGTTHAAANAHHSKIAAERSKPTK